MLAKLMCEWDPEAKGELDFGELTAVTWEHQIAHPESR